MLSGKRRCRFCDGDECRYTPNELQRLLSLQVIPVPPEKINDIESEDKASVYCTEEGHSNGEDYDEVKTIDGLLKIKILNSGNVPQQLNTYAKDCNGKIAKVLPKTDSYSSRKKGTLPNQ